MEEENHFPCPRCGATASINDSRCLSCGLVFYPEGEEGQDLEADDDIPPQRGLSAPGGVTRFLDFLKSALRPKKR